MLPGDRPQSAGSGLRIAVVHSYYSNRQPSGENVVVDLQVDALRRAGHEVELIARRTDDLGRSPLYAVDAALRVATGRGASPTRVIESFAPDVVHVHNLFPNFGRAWASRTGVPLVATLHNYRPMCPAGILFRDGAACSLCPDAGNARPAVVHRCYKGSRIASVPVALGTRFAADPLLSAADRLIALNDDMRRRYAALGIPGERLVTLPNFVPTAVEPGSHEDDFWLFVGRLTTEKGIDALVRDWPVGPRLKIVGSGPLEERLRRSAGPTVELLGQQANADVRRLLGRARGLCFPSVWPEGLPTVYLEALAAGLPVLAAPQSAVGDLVAEEGTGLVSGGPLVDDLERAEAEFPSLYERCRQVYDDRYTEASWVKAIVGLYSSVL